MKKCLSIMFAIVILVILIALPVSAAVSYSYGTEWLNQYTVRSYVKVTSFSGVSNYTAYAVVMTNSGNYATALASGTAVPNTGYSSYVTANLSGTLPLAWIESHGSN